MESLKSTLKEKSVILSDDFLPSATHSWVMQQVSMSEGRFERNGYDGKATLRDQMDPRGCGTRIINDRRNVLSSIWYTHLWTPDLAELPIYRHAQMTQGLGDSTLLSIYYGGDFYGSHTDIDMESIISCVLMLSFPFATFTGGELIVDGHVIPHRDNRLIMFPSCYEHEVAKINNDSTEYEDQRFSLQHFISAVRVKKPLLDESSNIQ